MIKRGMARACRVDVYMHHWPVQRSLLVTIPIMTRTLDTDNRLHRRKCVSAAWGARVGMQPVDSLLINQSSTAVRVSRLCR